MKERSRATIRSSGILEHRAYRLRFLEMFRSADASSDTWMTLIPPEPVEAHLKLDKQVMGTLRKQEMPVVPA